MISPHPHSTMSSIQFVVQPLPGTQDQLSDKLKSVADKINKYGVQVSSALTNIREEVKQIAVGPSHFAFLFEDGRLARLPFSVISDRLDLSKNSNKNNNAKGSGGAGSGGSGGGGSGGGGGGGAGRASGGGG